MTTQQPRDPDAGLLVAPSSADGVPAWLAEAISAAARLRATDLHFFPRDGEAELWLRIDGLLHRACSYPGAIHERAVSRLRVLARCPDYVREAVAEGRFSLTDGINGDAIRLDARLSIVPALAGEKAVVRMLHREGDAPLALHLLGFSARLCALLEEAVSRPQGLLLAVGPAGSGKSTTLAALLHRLNETSGRPLAMLTLEDPVERPLPFATQVTVDPSRGLDFANGLRALLRQDPEVILVGEIRDPETTHVALNAALTGHRLLSSLHTMNAAEALVRLQDMGAEPYVLASAIGGVLAQRLARRPCSACDGETPGCAQCRGLGFAGRTALGEWSAIGSGAVAALSRRAPARELARLLDVPIRFADEARSAIADGRTRESEALRLGVETRHD